MVRSARATQAAWITMKREALADLDESWRTPASTARKIESAPAGDMNRGG